MTRYLFAAVALLVAGCTVGPDFKRPEVVLPDTLGVAQSPMPPPEHWWTLFGDPVLERLVDEALAANHDLKAAAERIEQSRAQLTITRGDRLPSVDINATAARASRDSDFPSQPESTYSDTSRVALLFSWELDFWGKYRRAGESARAELVAAEAGRDAIRASLIGDVIRGYFTLQSLDRRTETVDQTLRGRAKAFELQTLRFDAGVVSEFEYRQVESDLRTTEALVPILRQARLRQEGALAVLFGRTPREVYEARVERGPVTLPEAQVPAGLPSDILLRRPDLREAEARLHAANARIGVARARYFPSITLTGFYGSESQSLGDLFSGPARTWNIAGGLLQPIFEAGQIAGGLDLANARTREAAQLYQGAVANAFREVRDAIAAQTNLREAGNAQLARERSLARAFELAKLRYENGAVSLFEVLDTERQLLLARLEAIDAERDRRAAIVDLYLAMGA